MSKSISVDISDFRRWAGSKISRLRDFRQPLVAVQVYFEQKIDRQFETETDPDGHPWEPLKPATLFKKQGRGSILVDSGKLRRSFVYDRTNDSLRISSTSPVFLAHNEGLKPQPERRILGISAEDKNAIAGKLVRYLRGR